MALLASAMPRSSNATSRQQFKEEMRAAWEAVDKLLDPELVFGKRRGRRASLALQSRLFV